MANGSGFGWCGCARTVSVSAVFGLAGLAVGAGPVVDFGRTAYGVADPVAVGDAPVVDPVLAVGDERLLVVQVDGEMTRARRAALVALGFEPVWSAGRGAFVGRAARGALAGLRGMDGVRFAGAMRLDQKMPGELARDLVAGATPARRYVLMPVGHGEGVWAEVSAAIDAAGGRVVSRSVEGLRVVAELDGAGVLRVVRSPAVLFCEAWSAPETDSVEVREVSGANVIENALGLTGAGVVGGVSDGGMYLEHLDYSDRPAFLQTGNTFDTGHGTAVFGVLFGSGDNDAEARGLLPSGNGVFASYYQFDDRDALIAGLMGPDVRGVFQSNSWGSGRTRVYTTDSVEMDDIVLRRDALLVQSQSNGGSQDSRPQAWAKNVVSVGGVEGYGTIGLSDDQWRGQASSGPGMDGRIKPDFVHFNDGLLTTDDDGPVDYRLFTGTSASTPAVAGLFGLLYEMWSTGALGNPVSGGDVWDERPSTALARALMVNTARPYPFSSAADDLSRYRQGWGIPDLAELWNRRGALAWWDGADGLEQGQSFTRFVEVKGDRSARFTLVFPDAPGAPFAIESSVNDLDLVVEAPNGAVYRGNFGLHDGVWSKAGGEADGVNTVENVFVPVERAMPGVWRVTVEASRVAADTGLGTPGVVDAPFALVATGGVEVEARGTWAALVEPVPSVVPTDAGWPVAVRVEGPADAVRVVERRGGRIVGSKELAPSGDGVWTGLAPAASCSSLVEMRVEVVRGGGVVAALPSGDGDRFYPLRAEESVVAYSETFDSPSSAAQWTVSGDASSGQWERAEPSGGGLRNDPPFASGGSGGAWVTQDGPGLRDVAGGPVVLVSPAIDLAGLPRPVMSFDAWLACEDAGVGAPQGQVAQDEDVMLVEVSADDGASWVQVDRVRSTFRWASRRVALDGVVPDGSVIRVRFSVSDFPNNSLTEAGVDNLRIASVACEPCPADLDGSGTVTFGEISLFLQLFSAGSAGADCDGNGVLAFGDLSCFLAQIGPGGCAGG